MEKAPTYSRHWASLPPLCLFLEIPVFAGGLFIHSTPFLPEEALCLFWQQICSIFSCNPGPQNLAQVKFCRKHCSQAHEYMVPINGFVEPPEGYKEQPNHPEQKGCSALTGPVQKARTPWCLPHPKHFMFTSSHSRHLSQYIHHVPVSCEPCN